MARKPRPANASPSKRAKAAPKSARAATPDSIIDAALDEAAAVGWRGLTLANVAARGGLNLGEVLLLVPTKACLLARFLDRIDGLMLAPVTLPDSRDKSRDRLFEIIMRRFDALNRHRAGARAFIAGTARDPLALATAGLRLKRTLAAMLAAADVAADGLMGCLLVEGLQAVYLATLRAWMNDDTADMAKTMAALDRALSQAERLCRFLPFRRPATASPA
jgi:AcrR family transcriptional regulator